MIGEVIEVRKCNPVLLIILIAVYIAIGFALGIGIGALMGLPLEIKRSGDNKNEKNHNNSFGPGFRADIINVMHA